MACRLRANLAGARRGRRDVELGRELIFSRLGRMTIGGPPGEACRIPVIGSSCRWPRHWMHASYWQVGVLVEFGIFRASRRATELESAVRATGFRVRSVRQCYGHVTVVGSGAVVVPPDAQRSGRSIAHHESPGCQPLRSSLGRDEAAAGVLTEGHIDQLRSSSAYAGRPRRFESPWKYRRSLRTHRGGLRAGADCVSVRFPHCAAKTSTATALRSPSRAVSRIAWPKMAHGAASTPQRPARNAPRRFLAMSTRSGPGVTM
jgi:hypothetical protein